MTDLYEIGSEEPVDSVPKLSTHQDIAYRAEMYGADDISITDNGQGDVVVRADVPPDNVDPLQEDLRITSPVGINVSVEPHSDVLSDQELLELVQALPTDCDDPSEADLSDIDLDQIQPLIEKYGGVRSLLRTAVNSCKQQADDAQALREVAEPSETQSNAIRAENVQHLFGNDETAEKSSTDESADTVEDAKQAYVDGEIGILELEERLEETIEVDVGYNPV